MSSTTIDFGIDLGTTNSSIARSTSVGIKVVKNRMHGDITPSAVARTRVGQTLVGQDALNKPDLSPATKFKRLMGTTTKTTLADGSIWLPEELSAEVLKDLKASVQRRFDVQPSHVVVTVPAMFQQPQCEATHKAAENAGLIAVSLLQEPIAAATAYLNEAPQDGYYMVYDLGGGTFDVSIVRVLDNAMSVVAHGGDNYLGGSDFDKIIANWVIGQLERKHGKLPELNSPVNQYRLLQVCEDAKKQLTDDENSNVDLGDFDLPTAQLLLQREAFETMIADPVAKTLRLCRERLEQAELRASDVRSVLLVGGPSMIPSVRRSIKEGLGIPINIDQDPMTVVAIGASIAASSILVADRSKSSPLSSLSAIIKLYYDPVSPETTCLISGKITQPSNFTGEVRLTRADEAWDSGWLQLRSSAFQCEVLLKPRTSSKFNISLRDMRGTLQELSLSSVTIRHGLSVATPVTPYNYGVALADGSFNIIIKENEMLPAVGTETGYRAAHTVPAGSAERLPIHFLEGSSRIAADNSRVGYLEIAGQDLTRTLKEGERIEVRIKMDESRRVEARVSVPLHDLEYKVPLTSIIEQPDESDLWLSIRESRGLAHEVQSSIAPGDEAKLQECQRDLEIVEAEMQSVNRSEPGAGERVVQKLMPIKAQLRELGMTYELDVAWRRAVNMIDNAEQVCRQLDARMGLASAQDLRVEAERSNKLEDVSGLNAIFVRAKTLYWQHYAKTPECWIGMVEDLKHDRSFAIDQLSYDEYLKRADDCLQRQDYEGVRLNGLRAISYLPESQFEAGRYSNAGLR